jgi:hypothetical protein
MAVLSFAKQTSNDIIKTSFLSTINQLIFCWRRGTLLEVDRF